MADRNSPPLPGPTSTINLTPHQSLMEKRKVKLNPKQYGGFKGLNPSDLEPMTFKDRRKKVEENLTEDQITHIDPIAVRCAEVPFHAWAAQKEKRVSEAFGRIIERDWYDKYELTLRPIERAHMNAVREHYAMRRDKIKTPDIQAKPKSNTLTKKEWCESMEAIEVLNKDTSVGSFFQGMVGKHIQKRLRREEKERRMREEEENNPMNKSQRRNSAFTRPPMEF